MQRLGQVLLCPCFLCQNPFTAAAKGESCLAHSLAGLGSFLVFLLSWTACYKATAPSDFTAGYPMFLVSFAVETGWGEACPTG